MRLPGSSIRHSLAPVRAREANLILSGEVQDRRLVTRALPRHVDLCRAAYHAFPKLDSLASNRVISYSGRTWSEYR